MIDVHCHLQFHSFEKDYKSVMTQAFESGVTAIINAGTKIDSSQKAVELANRYENLYAIVGIHPHHADKPDNGWEKELEKLTHDKKVVGIGEIGIDYFTYKSNGIVDPKLQQELFEKQIVIAHQANLPLQIHNRQAGKDVIKILTHHKNLLKNPAGMFHCFAGSMDILKSALELGFLIGFDGNVTYPGLAPGEDTDLKELARYTPVDRILAETDSPFLTPVPHRGSRNMPEYVILVARFLAQIKGIPFEQLQAQTTQNARTLFKLP